MPSRGSPIVRPKPNVEKPKAITALPEADANANAVQDRGKQSPLVQLRLAKAA